MKVKSTHNKRPINRSKGKCYVIDKTSYLENYFYLPENTSGEPEQSFEAILKATAEIVFSTDQKGNFLFINRTWNDYIGYTYEEVKSISLFDLVHVENLEILENRLAEVFRGNSLRDFEFKFKTRHGSFIDVQMNLSPILNPEGAVVAAFGIGRDITRYKHTIEELRDSEEIHRSIFENSPDVIFTTDTEGMVLSVNKASKSVLGFHPQELIGMNFKYIITKEALPQITEAHKQVIGGNKVVNRTMVITKDGEERQFEYITVPITKNGVVIKTQGMMHDITDHKRAEEKLRRILDSVSDGVIVTDLDGNVIELNERTSELHGHNSKEKLLGKNILKLIASSDRKRVLKCMKDTTKQGLIRNVEYRLLRKDGAMIWCELNASVLKDAYNKPVGLIFITRDISERKLSEERLHNYQQQLQCLTSQLSQTEERERRRLATDLHDLTSQPLAVTRMKLNALKDSLDHSSGVKAVKEAIELLDSAIHNTRALTFDLSPPVLYELGLEASLESLLEQFQKRHAITYTYEDDGQEKPLEDEVGILLYRCVSELLMNIIKHADARLIKLSVFREHNQVIISIEDDGIGFTISEAEGRSQGFGLFSIRERLNWINGLFEIQSQPGCGTRAILKAPLKLIKNDI